jgi:uncharacterized protein
MNHTQRVRDLYQAFARGDVTQVMQAMHPKVSWQEAEHSPYADGNPYVGPDEVAGGVFQRLTQDIKNLKLLPSNFIEANNAVVVEGRYQGLVKESGKQLDAQFVHIWHLQEGKIKRFQQYTDTFQWRVSAMSI